ncbi:unnamed protein product [Prorocentrum cordatum]|uniref:Ribosome biogenesis protein NOP53 n=1 Tax=Prorocentrum cordatum TaxID=2364126 RepID=A0ABN9SH57_9DINO|nr:unnamed protein product [Polarella glacialis]
MATVSLEGAGPRWPAAPPGLACAARLPRAEDVPWPSRLVPAAASEEDAGSEPPAFQPKTKTQRLRMQKKLVKTLAREALPLPGSSGGGPDWRRLQ